MHNMHTNELVLVEYELEYFIIINIILIASSTSSYIIIRS